MEYPQFISKLFWEYDLSSLDKTKHSQFIIGRILEKGNFRAIKWLFENYSQDEILKSLHSRNLSENTRFLWQNFFAKITPV